MKILFFLALSLFVSACTPSLPSPAQTLILTQTITPFPTATQTPSPIPTIASTPTQIGGGSGKFIFEYYKAAYEKAFPDLKGELNVFTSNLDGTDLKPITNGLNNINQIESISTDGQMVLVSSRSNYAAQGDLYLFRLDSLGSGPIKLAGGLTGGRQAIILNNSYIVYIGQGREGYGFYKVDMDGTDPRKIGAPIGRGWRIASSDKTRVYWGTIQKNNFTDSSGALYLFGDFQTLWWTNLDGSGQGKLESNGHQLIGDQYVFSPDGTTIAWIPAGLEPGCSLLGGLAIWTPYIRNGNLTKGLSKPSLFVNKNSPYLGKNIDIPIVEDYVRHCFLMHVASLANMDNDIKIPLIPPFDPGRDDFFYHKEYYLTWWPHSSKVLVYDSGDVLKYLSGVADHYPIALYKLTLEDVNPRLVQLKVLSNSSIFQSGPGAWPRVLDRFDSFNFSPDGSQIVFAKYSEDNQGSAINVLNLETMTYLENFSNNITPDMQVQRVGRIYWLP